MEHGVDHQYPVDLPQVAVVCEVVVVSVSSGHVSQDHSLGFGIAGLQLDGLSSCIHLCMCVSCVYVYRLAHVIASVCVSE